MNTHNAPYRHADGSNCWTKDCRLGNTSTVFSETFENWMPKGSQSIKGGWLRHSKASQYVTRVAMRMFGVDESTVASTLKELEREGRSLPAVSGEEAVAYFDDLAHKTADGQIESDEHERVVLLNKLKKAREEVKGGVAGGRMYAWKNLTKRIGSKLRTFAVIGFLAPTLVLTGCSAGTVSPPPTSSPTSSSSTSTAPSQTATPAPSSTSTTKTLPGSGKVAKDKYGSYEHVAPVESKFDKSELVDSSWKTAGFSLDEVKSARKFVEDFVTTQGVDSSAADGDESQWKQWIKDEAPKYIEADQLGAVTQDQQNGVRSGVIYNNPKGAITPTTRDGGVRLTKDEPYINSITGYTSPYNRLQVEGTVNATYRVSPESALAALKKARPKATEAELREQFAKAFNAKEDKLTVAFDFTYSVRKDGSSWKITGYSTNYKTEYAYN